MEPLTDAEVITGSLEEPAGFATVFDRHFGGVHGYLARRIGSESAADLAAEVFVIAFGARNRYDPGQPNARPWLLGIATNLLRHHWRIERQQLHAMARLPLSPMGDPETDAIERVDAAGSAAEVAAAVRDLRPSERDVLLLVAWADLTYPEVAEALHIPLGTVRSRLHRARRALRTKLSASASFPELRTTESEA